MANYIFFALLHISVICIVLFFFFILEKKNKRQIHYIFIANMVFMFIYSFSLLINEYLYNTRIYEEMFFINLSFLGVCFIPISILLTGIIYAKTKIAFSKKYWLLTIVPSVSCIIIFTNEYHNLFLIKYSVVSNEIIFGPYFWIHSIYSYICILVGLFYLMYFSIKNLGFFSRQSYLIIIGSIVPFAINILVTFNITGLPSYATSIAFSFAVICYAISIIKFNFLNIAPIALQSVVDRISDCFIVINEECDIIDYNKTFSDRFNTIIDIKRGNNVLNIFSGIPEFNMDTGQLLNDINESKENGKPVIFEQHMVINNCDNYFKIEITPIITNKNFLGTIILLKDITQAKKDLEIIKENQAILLEQERLASLGQLIGGIAHNLKTPIMSISGGIEALKDLAYEYRDSIDDRSVTEQDHKEIAMEMLSWLDKIKPYCAYMSDVISAVKGQAVQMNASTTAKFTVDELVKRVDLLLKHELKKYHCILNTESHMDMSTEIKGEVNNLVQVFDNIIINAMQAYDGQMGTIDLKIAPCGDNVEFTFRDYGKGIPRHVADRLFKEMVTTKGKNGTGLGLYMSYSTVKGRFGGNMSFTSIEGCGTTFLISVPCITYNNQEVG